MSRAPIIPNAIEPGEVVSLTERLARLQLLRVALIAIALAGASLAFAVSDSALEQLWTVSGGYLAIVAAATVLHRGGRRLSLVALGIMVLLDGVYLGWVTYLTGGTQSPLHFLLYVHLVAVTLLASYRTGLKIALWHSLLSFVALYAQAAGLIAARESAPGLVPTPETGLASLPVFNVVAFWVVALVTAAFSALNERELRRRRADSEAVAEMATEMEQLHGPEDIAAKLLDWVGDGYGFGRGVVLSTRDGLSVLAHRGAGELAAAPKELDRVIRDAWETRNAVLVKGLDPERDPVLTALLPRARRVLVLPLFSENELLGAVALEHVARGWRIERRIVAVTSQLVAYAALALRNAWLVDQIRRMAHTDGLTGVANRRMFDDALTRQLARARRSQASASLLLIDVDHFKSFNDNHGHVAGDAALQGLAQVLVSESRSFDLVARYGGEEFAVILPDCSVEESVRIAERLRMAAHRVPGPAPMTVSIGAATCPNDALETDALIRAADDALYASKRQGRNRVARPNAPTPIRTAA